MDTKSLDLEIPRMAESDAEAERIELELQKATTRHLLRQGDARDLSWVPSESVHLVVTSPPYWTLKLYPTVEGQLGLVGDYETFVQEISKVWAECYRVLIPGGRLIVVVGDVCLSRKKYGRHVVFPLHADIQVACRKIGFDNLAPIIWSKIANASYEVENGSRFFGKPYEPNAIVKNDMEFILMERKSGAYRSPSPEQRSLSLIPKRNYERWFQQIWTDVHGESTRQHPAPFPLELAHRLVRMFSFYGDTVLDPFVGTGTTMLAALQAGRNSIGVEVDPDFLDIARARLQENLQNLYRRCQLEVVRP